MSFARMPMAAACFVALVAAAADKPCTPAEASNAEKMIDRVVNWQQLHKAWQDYARCDSTPSVADMYTDAILRLTVDWKNVDAFAASMKDAEYRKFVYAHLATAGKDDKDAVFSRAKASCPKGLDDFCDGIAEAVLPPEKPAAPPAPAPAKSQ